jgi:hypothetical protein
MRHLDVSSMTKALLTTIAVVTLCFGVFGSSSKGSTTSVATLSSCSPLALAAPFSGPDELDAISNFGCDRNAAFVWATVGGGNMQVGVTEVEVWDSALGRWRFALREAWCNPENKLQNRFIYQNGCLSN